MHLKASVENKFWNYLPFFSLFDKIPLRTLLAVRLLMALIGNRVVSLES